MRLCLVAAGPLCLMLAMTASAQQKHFPYKAYVTSDDVYVRSGPGKSYYPTTKLKAGEVIEVYRHDPGGWYAVRPPAGSYTWVSGKYLDVGKDGLAKVTGDRVAARVGSQFSSIRDVIQIRLHEGEVVEILDSQEFDNQPEAGTWYKIAPPSGEFRWIFGRYADPNYADAGVRKAPAGRSPLIQASRGGGVPTAVVDEPARLDEQQTDSQVVTAEHESTSDPSEAGIRTAQHWMPVGSQALAAGPASVADRTVSPASGDSVQAPATIVDPNLYTNKFQDPATDPNGSATMRRLSPEEFQAELDDVNLELSLMLSEEPTVWTFNELSARAESLQTQAETAIERGRARLLVTRIEQSADVKNRYDAVNAIDTKIERQNRQFSKLGESRMKTTTQPEATEDRFDATGRLRRVVSEKVGAPQYALVDEEGNVRCFVSPAPDLNMQYYLGREVGVTGVRGYIAEQRARHVTAKHVTALDDSVLR